MAAPHKEAVQKQEKQIHQDWLNREYIEVITVSIKKITDFLNSFGMLHLLVEIYKFDVHLSDLSCRSKLAVLNEKLTTLERKIDYLEACVSFVFGLIELWFFNQNYFLGNKRRNVDIMVSCFIFLYIASTSNILFIVNEIK